MVLYIIKENKFVSLALILLHLKEMVFAIVAQKIPSTTKMKEFVSNVEKVHTTIHSSENVNKIRLLQSAQKEDSMMNFSKNVSAQVTCHITLDQPVLLAILQCFGMKASNLVLLVRMEASMTKN